MSDDKTVKELLPMIEQGSLVIPDFQRTFIWEPEDVRELIVSVLGGYFIGSMLILESLSGVSSLFKLRLIEGVAKVNTSTKIQSQVKVLLDGQQRITALFYALREPEIPLKGRKNPYKIFIDLDKALSKEWDSAVRIINTTDKKKLKEISTNPNIIPAKILTNVSDLALKFLRHPRVAEIIEIANNFLEYSIRFVLLPSDTGLEKIVETFERVNRTGQPLQVFDLIAARLFKDGIKLRDLWEETKKYPFAHSISPEFVLRSITLIRGKGTKRKALLELVSTDFIKDWDSTCHSMQRAYDRIIDNKTGYGAFIFSKWVPYSTMIVTLTAIDDYIYKNKLNKKENWDKIDRWYWVSVFDSRYDEGATTKQESDFQDLKKWLTDNEIPDFINDFNAMQIDFNMRKQNSAVYRGVIALCVLKGALDFESGQAPKLFEKDIEDDHIFPQSIYHEDVVLNRTLLSTNSKKGDKRPSEYFKERIEQLGEEQVKKLLETHLIPPQAFENLLKDDLKSFLASRRKAIHKELKHRINKNG